eukprot:2787525-Rhodomonas_salina.1
MSHSGWQAQADISIRMLTPSEFRSDSRDSVRRGGMPSGPEYPGTAREFVDYTPKSNTRNRVTGTSCAENT